MNKKLLRALAAVEPVPAEPLREAETERLLEKAAAKRHAARRPALPVLWKTAGALAAAFVLLVGVGVVNPVFAENIPVVSDIAAFLRRQPYAGHTLGAGAGVEENMVPVTGGAETAAGRTLAVQDAYFDGSVLAVTLAADVPGLDGDAAVLSAKLTLLADGQSALNASDGALFVPLYRAGGDTFCGVAAADIRSADVGDRFTLTVKTSSVEATNPNIQVFNDESHRYEAKTFDFSGTLPEVTAEIARSAEQQVYEIGESFDGGAMTLRAVRLSPACTQIDMEVGEEAEGRLYWTASYDGGEELRQMPLSGPESGYYFEPLPESAQSVTVTVRRRLDNAVVGTYTLPVAGGYAKENGAFAAEQAVRTAETVFEPPLGETASLRGAGQTEGRTVVPFDTAVESRVDSKTKSGLLPALSGWLTGPQYEDPDVCMKVRFSNLQVFASHTAAGLSDGDLALPPDSLRSGEDPDDCRFVTMNIHLENNGCEGHTDLGDELALYSANDGTASTFWISEFAYALIRDDIDGQMPLAYFSGHMNGLSNYFHFAMNRYDSRDFTVGFYIPAAELENGGWAVAVQTAASTNDFNASHVFVELPAPKA